MTAKPVSAAGPASDAERRARWREHPDLLGLDFVTVERLSDALWRLRVHLLPSPDNRALVAEVTAANVVVTLAELDLPDPSVHLTAVGPDSDGLEVLRVELAAEPRLAAPGLAPQLALRLVGLGRLDPFFDHVRFRLRPEAGAPTHPVDAYEPPPLPLDGPPISYLAKDYASFRELVLGRMTVLAPRWHERNPSDLGIMLVELMAYVGDYLSYYQDAVGTEAYLATARRRRSVGRHARLLDYAVATSTNARVWLQVAVTDEGVPLPAGTRFAAGLDGSDRLGTDVDLTAYADPSELRLFESVHTASFFASHASMPLHTWGLPRYALSRGSVTATLSGSFPHLRRGDVLVLEQARSPESGRADDADASHRHAVRLSAAPELGRDPASRAPVTHLEWYAQDALPFDLLVANRRFGAGLAHVAGNIVLADNGQTISPDNPRNAEVVYHGRNLSLALPDNVTFREPAPPTLGSPALGALEQDARHTVAAVRLVRQRPGRNGEDWAAVRDLLGSGRFARHFVLELEGDEAAARFGDDCFGWRPPNGARFRVGYHIDDGPSGNVGRECITHVITDDPRVTGVRNPLPAEGGRWSEQLAHVRRDAPWAFRQQERCVTEADYAAMAQRSPSILRALARLRWTGSWYTAFVYAQPPGGGALPQTVRRELRSLLERHRLAGEDVRVCDPEYVPLEVHVRVAVRPGYAFDRVRQALLEVLSSKHLSDGRMGFFCPQRLGFGEPVYVSQIVAYASDIPGIERLEVPVLRRWGARDAPGGAELLALGPTEIARLDNLPGLPQLGVLELMLVEAR